MDVERFCYRRGARGDMVLGCPLLQKLRLTAKETLRWKVASAKVTRYDAEQLVTTGRLHKQDAERRASTIKLQKRVDYYKEPR